MALTRGETYVKWTREQLLQDTQNVTFDEDMEIDASAFDSDTGINGVRDIHIDGSGYLDDENNRFYCELHVSGTMLCPDAITNEEIEVPLDTKSSEVYVFGKAEEDGERAVDEEVIDLTQAVIDDILLEVPLQVTEAAEDEYPEGDGWKVYSEAAYQESRKDHIDPRLAKLKQFKDE
jgi:uncharacterized protein